MIETHRESVRRLTTKDHTFASPHFHRFLPRWKSPRETPWKIAENRTLKSGSSPPRARLSVSTTAAAVRPLADRPSSFLFSVFGFRFSVGNGRQSHCLS